MRILVLGAGGIGGYFGGRLVEKGEDVTFLVRPKRQQQLKTNGLHIRSVHGDLTVHPKTITANHHVAPFDLVLLSTKSYHLEGAIEDVKPFIGDNTVVLPLLNGMAHIPLLKKALGDERVIGGMCYISTTLDSEGIIEQTSPFHRMIIGELDQRQTTRIRRIADVLDGTKATLVLSDHIEQDMWHKYLYIAALSGVTTLTRAPVGPIRDSVSGQALMRKLFIEIASIMQIHGAPIPDDLIDKHIHAIETGLYSYKSSMLRDMERDSLTEGEHIQGYLLILAEKYRIDASLLQIVYQNLDVYNTWLKSLASEKEQHK